jgi:DNA-binding MarR family transcriptional regulator
VTRSAALVDRSLREAARQPDDEDYAALARFRAALRNFLAFSEQAAVENGMTMQWYQALLVVRTAGQEAPISVGQLAEQLMIRDHSAAELVTRLVEAKLVRRKSDPADRRRSLLIMTPAGDRSLAKLAAMHLERLRESRDLFLALFDYAGR